MANVANDWLTWTYSAQNLFPQTFPASPLPVLLSLSGVFNLASLMDIYDCVAHRLGFDTS